MRISRLMVRSFLLSLALAGLMAPVARAQQLTEFRAPNELEAAYIGIAAQLLEPGLCRKISDLALYRGRKPILARSRCFYYIALNSGMLSWCEEVKEIPVAVGLMNWLEPERCRYQVQRQRSDRVYQSRFDHAAIMNKLGYERDSIPAEFRKDAGADWRAFYDLLVSQSDLEASEDFRSRLAGLPDFNTVERDQDAALRFTEKEEAYEASWMMMQGVKMCLYGRGSDNCNPKGYAMMRAQTAAVRGRTSKGRLGISAQGLSGNRGGSFQELRDAADPTGGTTAFRRPLDIERAYYDLALGMKDPSSCRGISPDALAVGWTTEPGLLFMPLRSICLTAVASLTKDAAPCDEVTALARDDLDGADLTLDRCREIAAGKAPSPQRDSLKPNWETSLRALGFTEAERAEAAARVSGGELNWAGLAARSMKSWSPLHARLRARLARALGPDRDDQRVDDGLFYAEMELQKHLYQLTATRFHCTVRDNQRAAAAEAIAPPAPLSPAGEFTLTDHRGKRVSDKTYRGDYVLVYFGYTLCPDVCPISLQAMIAALDLLGEPAASRIQPVFITVDPRRDTAERLAQYVELFDPRLQGLTGTAAEIRQAARGYGVYYYAGEVDGNYVVDHTGFTYLIDPEGRHVANIEHGADPEDIAAVLRRHVSPPAQQQSHSPQNDSSS